VWKQVTDYGCRSRRGRRPVSGSASRRRWKKRETKKKKKKKAFAGVV